MHEGQRVRRGLRQQRPDLAGLPFMMGDACRLKDHERDAFGRAVIRVRGSLQPRETRDAFWQRQSLLPKGPRTLAALTQMLATEASLTPGFIEYLASCDSKEATQALARIAIFAPEEWIRHLACDVLRLRDTNPATDVLLQGLRYPWPAVARNSGEALVRLLAAVVLPASDVVMMAPRSASSAAVSGGVAVGASTYTFRPVPLYSAASITSTPTDMPLMMRLRMGKFWGAAKVPIGNSETRAPPNARI